MPVTINGSTGIVGPDGSAGTPSVQGADSNTGVFFPAADTVAIATGGSERLRVDSSGNVGIGTSSPSYKLDVSGEIRTTSHVRGTGSDVLYVIGGASNNNNNIYVGGSSAGTANTIAFTTAGSERARIDSSGNLLVGTTSQPSASVVGIALNNNVASNASSWSCGSKTTANTMIQFINGNGQVGNIQTSGSATTYATSSDYRLKENVQPMTGALAKVQSLKPVTYKWKVDGSDGEGFIAHELAEVVPQCVSGEKDAVDADGNPVYQGIDTSFLVATLTAAIQELTAKLDAAEARIAALEAA